jgi:type IV pilus assembly protein PilQ
MKATTVLTGAAMALMLLATTSGVLAQWPTDSPATSQAPARTEAAGTDQVIDLFEVDNAEIRGVFKQLSAFSGVDIVLSDKVKGAVTLKVTNKTWKEVFNIVCKLLNLSAIKEPNYLYVMSSDEYKNQMLESSAFAQVTQGLGELQREIITLNNTSAAEMSEAVKSLLSTRGKITVVEHNNALIVFDAKDNVDQIKKTIHQLDVETPQISISCKIIQVSSGDLQEMGVHWGFFDTEAGVNVQHSDKAGMISAKTLIEKLSYGVLSPERFSIALEYLFEDKRAEIVAQPQITTLDNKQASMFTGNQIPVKYVDIAGNTVVQMVSAGTELIVTPHVTGENRISMVLNPKKKSYVMNEGTPIISEQSAQTNVVVNDGETVVIAGLTSNESQNSERGIPILKDIPIIGNLFKKSLKSSDKSDLVIFVTPHILSKKVDAATSQTTAVPQ